MASGKRRRRRLRGIRSQLAKSCRKCCTRGRSGRYLIVLQGMDTAGKDGTISHIFSGINPQGCDVASFKVPTPLEARHDFLWRCHARVPAKGMMTIFNRSHYEDVLAPRVHKLIYAQSRPVSTWTRSITLSKCWSIMAPSMLKFFLHISKDEQKKRLQARLDRCKDKLWKFSAADLTERGFWADYQAAYEDVLEHTSKKHAPWFVVPADHKAYRNLAISKVLVDSLTRVEAEVSSAYSGSEDDQALALLYNTNLSSWAYSVVFDGPSRRIKVSHSGHGYRK